MGLYSNEKKIGGSGVEGYGVTLYVERNCFNSFVSLGCIIISIDTSVNMRSIHVDD